MAQRPSNSRHGAAAKLTGWPRPAISLGRRIGLNPFRIGVLVALALGGVAGGYLIGARVVAPPPLPAPVVNATPKAPAPVIAAPQKPPALPRSYEESLPRDIVIETDGRLTHFGLPMPDAEIDLGSKPLTDKAPETPQPAPAATPDATASAVKSLPPAETEVPSPAEAAPEVALAPAAQLIRALPDNIAELQRTKGKTLPAWERYALPVTLSGKPLIVIVMDDLGLDRRRTRQTVELPGPLTLSFMAYAEDLPAQIERGHAAGHEMMLHVPMEPSSSAIDPGPNVLLSGMPKDEILKNVSWNLDQVSGFVGINNHMGSRFTEDRDGMQVVADALKKRGLLFLDSVTSGKTVAHDVARDAGIPFAVRNVFLDHDDDLESIRHQLRQVEQIAQKTGLAIAIGHPRDKTLSALKAWLPKLKDKGFQLVPVSAVARITKGE